MCTPRTRMPEPSTLRRQRATRLSAVALLLAAIVFVIIDQALKPCLEDGSGSLNVTEPDAQNATLCSDCRSSGKNAACTTVFMDAFIGWVQDNPAAGSVALAAVYAVGAVCFVPGSILTLGAGAAFGAALGLGWGVVVGTLAVWVGAAVEERDYRLRPWTGERESEREKVALGCNGQLRRRRPPLGG